MKSTSTTDLARAAAPFLDHAQITADDPAYLLRVLELLKEKVSLLSELPARCRYFFDEQYAFDPAAVEKSCAAAETCERLSQLANSYEQLDTWDATSLESTLKQLAAELGVKNALLIHPCRVAVSGMAVGPSLYHMLEVLGQERVTTRLRRAASLFQK